MLQLDKLLSQEDFNRLLCDDVLVTVLNDTAKHDREFTAVQGYPGGTIIANSKESVRLHGFHVALGTKFSVPLLQSHNQRALESAVTAAALKLSRKDRRLIPVTDKKKDKPKKGKKGKKK